MATWGASGANPCSRTSSSRGRRGVRLHRDGGRAASVHTAVLRPRAAHPAPVAALHRIARGARQHDRHLPAPPRDPGGEPVRRLAARGDDGLLQRPDRHSGRQHQGGTAAEGRSAHPVQAQTDPGSPSPQQVPRFNIGLPPGGQSWSRHTTAATVTSSTGRATSPGRPRASSASSTFSPIARVRSGSSARTAASVPAVTAMPASRRRSRTSPRQTS